MTVTNAQNEKTLQVDDVNELLNSYIQSLQSTVVMTNPKGSNYSSELQGFINTVCEGIDKTAKLRQRLADEQYE